MSMIKIWVHLVFTTKYRKPMLTKEIRYLVHNHIAKNCREKGIFLREINGHTDHVHCLISLGNEQTIANVAMLIKGESSYWINKQKLTASKFMWQDDYYVKSISLSHLNKVTNYIKNQEAHHAQHTFEEEYSEFMKEFTEF